MDNSPLTVNSPLIHYPQGIYFRPGHIPFADVAGETKALLGLLCHTRAQAAFQGTYPCVHNPTQTLDSMCRPQRMTYGHNTETLREKHSERVKDVIKYKRFLDLFCTLVFYLGTGSAECCLCI